MNDGFHTFDELYEHRNALMLALMKQMPNLSWFTKKHDDGTMYEGFFLVGIDLDTGQISYHIHQRYWETAVKTGATQREKSCWDGHTSGDVITRLLEMVSGEKI